MASKIYNQSNMSTADVKKMQQALVDAGYSVGSSGVDGVWGKDTAAALSQFKKDTGGSNTYGTTVGNETFNKLYGNKGSGSIPSSAYGSTPDYGGGVVGAVANPYATVQGTDYTLPINNDIGINAYEQIYASQNNLNQNLGALDDTYAGYVSQLEGGANKANAALDEARQNALAGIKQTYDNSARNYYRMYRAQEKELPEQLSSIGATGGATESAALRLMNNYSDNLYKNETARNQDTNSLNEEYYNAVANNSKQLASQLASAYMQLEQNKLSAQNAAYEQQAGIYNQYLQNKANEQSSAAKRDVATANATTDAQIAALKAAGNKVYTYTDADGYKRYTVGESKSKSGSSGGTSGGNDNNYTPSGSYSYSDIVKAINNGNLSGANSMAYSAAMGGNINQAQANLIASTLAQIASGYTPTQKTTGSTKKK